MSSPSFSNIDRWLFEWVEGNLTPEQITQLQAFLLNNPDLDIDKDAWDMAHVKKEEVILPNQQKYYRKRPVGIYMMTGFTCITIFLGLIINSLQMENVDVANNSLTQAKNQKVFAKNNTNSLSKKNSIETLNPTIEHIQATINSQGFIQNEFDLIRISQLSSALNDEDQHQLKNYGLETTNELKAKKVKLLHIAQAELISKSAEKASKSSAKHSSSFFTKFKRKIQRMMDQSVALTNLKDPNFMVPGLSSIDANMSGIGTLPGARFQSMSRFQWAGEVNEQIKNQLAFDTYIYGIRGGIGVKVNNDVYAKGQIVNSSVAIAYSPKFALNKNVLFEPSIGFKMGSKSIHPKSSTIGMAEMDRDNEQEFYPQGINPTGKNLFYRDLALGMMVNTKWFFAGIQGDNLLRHYDNIYSGNDAINKRADYHFIATLGTDYESAKGNFAVSPFVLYQNQERLSEFWFGANARIHTFTIGASVSDNLDAVVNVGFKLKRFALTAQSDYVHSSLLNKKILSYQLNMKVLIFNQFKKQKYFNL